MRRLLRLQSRRRWMKRQSNGTARPSRTRASRSCRTRKRPDQGPETRRSPQRRKRARRSQMTAPERPGGRGARSLRSQSSSNRCAARDGGGGGDGAAGGGGGVEGGIGSDLEGIGGGSGG